MIDPAAVPVASVQWNPCYRLIASRFPTVGLFDSVTSPQAREAVFAVESLTNERLRDEVGDWELVPPAERVVGPGATPIMASFTHLNPLGSRFSDGAYGVYYCTATREAAIAEVSYHHGVFLRRTRHRPIDVDLRLITARLAADLHDLRGWRQRAPDLYDPISYQTSQRFGAQLKESASWGIAYNSVRLAGGECAGLFRPRALSGAFSAGHIALHWDGVRITHWYEKGMPLPVRD